MKIFSKNKSNQAAFSLIEMMTVVLIVAVGLVGTTQLIAQSLNAQMINKGGIVAYQLAQEGIEIIRQRRDSNQMQGLDWRDGLANGTYCVDYITPLVIRETTDTCPLHFDNNNWYYSPELAMSNPSFSGFNRIIKISENDTNSIKVQAIVTWNNREQIIEYLVETDLYNWY